MPDSTEEITIKLTPRAAAYLKTLLVAHAARIADQRQAVEDEKSERLRAAAEGRHPEAYLGAHRLRIPDLTYEQIAERALERGAAAMLALVLQPTFPEDLAHQVPLYQRSYPIYPGPV